MEATHPEFLPSQHELNFVPADPLKMADRHIITKHGIRDMAKQSGMTASFMAKLNSTSLGNSCHIHMSLQDAKTGKNAFYDQDDEFGMSTLARNWMELELPPPASGNIYNDKELPEFPNSLQKAMDLLRESKMLNKTFVNPSITDFADSMVDNNCVEQYQQGLTNPTKASRSVWLVKPSAHIIMAYKL
uniref:Gln-synt_C domain-containing protein n=1 Tax=Meloidogyne hapla TaxID=6305 RepID=A0A1I8BCG2_MELHA